MRLKSWFCFLPLERLKQQPDRRAQADENAGSKHALASSRGPQSAAMPHDPEHTAHMLLCQAIVDASPEAVSIYNFETGQMVLCNAACRELPVTCVSLTTLFAMDLASLQDALSRVRAGQCWRGATTHSKLTWVAWAASPERFGYPRVTSAGPRPDHAPCSCSRLRAPPSHASAPPPNTPPRARPQPQTNPAPPYSPLGPMTFVRPLSPLFVVPQA
jgi:hypothetical protein